MNEKSVLLICYEFWKFWKLVWNMHEPAKKADNLLL